MEAIDLQDRLFNTASQPATGNLATGQSINPSSRRNDKAVLYF